MMGHEEFTNIFDAQVQRSRDILIEKAKEYSTDDDRLANFKAAAALQGVPVTQALAGMAAKHAYSVFKMCNDGQSYTEAQWDEKITDLINYMILLKAITVEDSSKKAGFPQEVLDEISANAHERPMQNKEKAPASPEFVFYDLVNAHKFIDDLNQVIKNYNWASMLDSSERIGLTGTLTDERWGWSSLDGTVIVVQGEHKYEVILPRPTRFPGNKIKKEN